MVLVLPFTAAPVDNVVASCHSPASSGSSLLGLLKDILLPQTFSNLFVSSFNLVFDKCGAGASVDLVGAIYLAGYL